MATSRDNLLGAFLRDRRGRLDPATFGFGSTRRRTPGLRREEVAQRAHVSVTWYTWLEQGRGGTPSAEVLDHLAEALVLTEAEREHLFLLAQQRPPRVRQRAAVGVTPVLQRTLDALELSPAYVKTSAWDVVAWNRAAATVLTDYPALAPEQRNVLRLLFGDPQTCRNVRSWERDARLAVATFRLETTRVGITDRARALVTELSRSSPQFASLWSEHDVGTHGEGTKHVDHPIAGPLTLDYSAFAVDDHPDLGLVIMTPATTADRDRIRSLLTT